MNPGRFSSSLFAPKETLSDKEVDRGLRWLMWEGVASMGFGSITGSGFLAAFALLLGANNLQIGILASIPFATMPLQVFTVALVTKLKRRKLIAVPAWALAQLIWVPIALIPVFMDTPGAGPMSVLLGLVAIRGILTAVQNAAWNSWMRELVPRAIMGTYFARRLSFAQVASMIFGLGAALYVDYWKRGHSSDDAVFGYTIAIIFGAMILGLASPAFRALMPERQMQDPPGGQQSLIKSLAEPYRDSNFKHFVRFMFFWNFATQLAVPFFAVYMLTVLDFSLTAVMALSVLSQASNAFFLRMWGPLSDRVGAKPVLSLSASLYLLVILGWTFTTMPDRYFLTVPLLILLHILAGAAAAGVNVTSGTVALKIAPEGKSPAFLSAQSVAANMGAAIGPLIGGLLIDFFQVRSLSLDFTWTDPGGVSRLPALNLTGFDFMFGIAFLVGLATLQFLTLLREEGEVTRDEVLDAMLMPMQRAAHATSAIPGMGIMTHLPYEYLRRVPVPGFDVAMGVTAYQVSESVRLATVGAGRGRQQTGRLAQRVADSVRGIARQGENIERHISELATHAAKGAVHGAITVGRTPVERTAAITEAITGVIRGADTGAGAENRDQAVDAAAYGAVQGAIEAGADPTEAGRAAIRAARELGSETDAERLANVAEKAAQRAVDDAFEPSDDQRLE